MSTEEAMVIDTLITEMNTKKALADEIMEEVEAIKVSIRERMVKNGTSRLETANHSVSYTECKRTSFDTKKLQQEFPELFGHFAKVSKYMILKIK